LCDKKDTVQVDTHHLLPLFRGDLHKGILNADAGVVNQHIHPLQYCVQLSKSAGNRLRVGNISSNRATQAWQFLGNALAGDVITIQYDDARSFF
jgi:hypothetical protein